MVVVDADFLENALVVKIDNVVTMMGDTIPQ